jgi:hypothetical protein
VPRMKPWRPAGMGCDQASSRDRFSQLQPAGERHPDLNQNTSSLGPCDNQPEVGYASEDEAAIASTPDRVYQKGQTSYTGSGTSMPTDFIGGQ